MRVTEGLGRIGGAVLAPVFAGGSLLRRARLFHPHGAVYKARVSPVGEGSELHEVAKRLEGEALVRLSNAWWKKDREWRDLLGFSLRIGDEPIGIHAGRGDQDLLFATLRSPWTMGLAPITTNTHDFLANDYYAVSPFEVEGVGRARLRVVSPRVEAPGDTRAERLDNAVKAGAARFWLELKPVGLGHRWRPLAEIALEKPVHVAQESLRFSPFQSDRGFEPVGFVHALRRATYPAAQTARGMVHGGHFPTSLPRL